MNSYRRLLLSVTALLLMAQPLLSTAAAEETAKSDIWDKVRTSLFELSFSSKKRSSRRAMPGPLSVSPMTSAATATARRNDSWDRSALPRRRSVSHCYSARRSIRDAYAVSTRRGVKYFAVCRRCSRCSGPSR